MSTFLHVLSDNKIGPNTYSRNQNPKHESHSEHQTKRTPFLLGVGPQISREGPRALKGRLFSLLLTFQISFLMVR